MNEKIKIRAYHYQERENKKVNEAIPKIKEESK